jgi:DNA-binding transcriptional LysR family regulator
MIDALDTDRLVAFVTVARERGFSRAARELGKTQSAVSQAVSRLEEELGQRLFVRDGRTTRLTEAGRVLLEHGERVLSEMAAARDRLSSLGELRAGSLVIGTSDTLACYLLPPVFAAYRARYPGVELRLSNRPSPATAAEVAENRVDVGVVTLPLPAPGPGRREGALRVRVERWLPHQDVVICPPRHPFARAPKVAVRDLGAESLVLLDRTTGTRAYLDAAFERARIEPRVTMEMGSVEVLKRLVELGFGVSVVPALATVREVRAGTLAAIPLMGAPGGREVGILLPAAGASRAALAFLDLARAEIRAADPTVPKPRERPIRTRDE